MKFGIISCLQMIYKGCLNETGNPGIKRFKWIGTGHTNIQEIVPRTEYRKSCHPRCTPNIDCVDLCIEDFTLNFPVDSK